MKFKTIFIIFISFLLVGCSSLDTIDFEKANISYCENSSSDENLIVNSMEEFEEKRCEFNDDNNTSINFEKYTLLGKYTTGSGCSVNFDKKITRDDENNKIKFIIDVNGRGLCDGLAMSNNYILVPKVPQDYEIEFIVNNKRSE